jgi:Flp pilus assembly secretin CpaC
VKPFRQSHTPRFLAIALTFGALFTSGARSGAQQPADDQITRIDLPAGRSYPITTVDPILRVSVATPEIADAVVVDERNVVINAKAMGETDIILWITNEPRRHYRISVRSAADRKAVLLSVRVAEVRRDDLNSLGVNLLHRDPGGHARVGTGIFNTDNSIDPATGKVILDAATTKFATLLTDFGTTNLLSFIDAEAVLGHAKILAEPNLIAGNHDTASFLAGGEIPVPIAQPTTNGAPTITIQYREFGIRLTFIPEIVSDSLIKLNVHPEVSSLDFTNAVEISGFRIPALRTRRIGTTVDVRRDQSLVLSGLLDDERTFTRTGVPLLSQIPILGALFGNSSWEVDKTELLIVVTPVIVNPLNPPASSVLRILPDTNLPAREAIEKRLPPPPIKP